MRVFFLQLRFESLLVIFLIFFSGIQTQAQQRDISGQWYVQGNESQSVLITQNQQYLNFTMGQYQSTGYFYSENQVFAKEWNAYGTVSSDNKSITWNDQVWLKGGTNTNYPNITGKYIINGDNTQIGEIQQNGNNLTLIMSNSSSQGRFVSVTQIFATDWNAYANLSDNGKTITWSDQVWKRTSGGTVNRGPYKSCRGELSTFYGGCQALGTVWGRCATSPRRLDAQAITDCRASLNALNAVLDNMPCIVFDRTPITNLFNNLSVRTNVQLVDESVALITALQTTVARIDPDCDNGVNLVDIYVAGVHLGAAQAWASSQQCLRAPMALPIQTNINRHLTTARNALTNYQACLEGFDFNVFTRVPVNSTNSILPHTHIVGIETHVLWTIALSDCCCDCSEKNVIPQDPCDAACQKHCQSLGKQDGKYNGHAICLGGRIDQPTRGCDCW